MFTLVYQGPDLGIVQAELHGPLLPGAGFMEHTIDRAELTAA